MAETAEGADGFAEGDIGGDEADCWKFAGILRELAELHRLSRVQVHTHCSVKLGSAILSSGSSGTGYLPTLPIATILLVLAYSY